jgi:nitrous oxidase accessory protein NosD
MPNIESIPVGSDVFEELNVFRVIASPRLVLQDLVMDGKNRGSVRGHTIYGGVYASGDYTPGEAPVAYGLTVRGCTLRGFMGRAICVYGVGGVVIENNGIYDTFAQAVELDHFSQGRVVGNTIENAEVGVMLNDCFDSLVESNRITGCLTGVHLLRIFPQTFVNTGNVVRGNVVGPGCDVGVSIVDRLDVGLHGNSIRGNHFIGLGPEDPVLDPFANDVRDNTVEP